jgi:chromosome partitioning protein
MTRIICNINRKGGGAKTCSVLNTGAALSMLGKKVLFIDLDDSADLTWQCGIEPESLDKTVYQVAIGQARPEDVVIHLPKFDLLPANEDLAGAVLDFTMLYLRKGVVGESILREQLKGFVEQYDYVLYDTGPSLTKLTTCALIASNEVFVVMLPECLSVRAVKRVNRAVEEASENNPSLRITGAYVTMFDQRKGIHKGYSEYVKNSFGADLFETKIRTCVALSEISGNQVDIFDYNMFSNGAKDYLSLAHEIVQQEGNHGEVQ